MSIAGSPMEMESSGAPFIIPKKSIPLGTILSQKRPLREPIALSKRYEEISSDDSEDGDQPQPSTSKRVAKKTRKTLNSPKPTNSKSQVETAKK